LTAAPAILTGASSDFTLYLVLNAVILRRLDHERFLPSLQVVVSSTLCSVTPTLLSNKPQKQCSGWWSWWRLHRFLSFYFITVVKSICAAASWQLSWYSDWLRAGGSRVWMPEEAKIVIFSKSPRPAPGPIQLPLGDSGVKQPGREVNHSYISAPTICLYGVYRNSSTFYSSSPPSVTS
jgi:hypothetical protein